MLFVGWSLVATEPGVPMPATSEICGPSFSWTMWPSVSLLPESIRQGYGLAWGRRQQLVSAWLTAGYRAWRPILPLGFRTMPWALAADARLARQLPG